MTGFDLTPWYQLVEARDLLRKCVDSPPRVITATERYGRKVEEYSFYDPDDARVARLTAILVHHTTPIINHPQQWRDAVQAGTLVSVEMAIDAVMPGGPLCGSRGNPAYMESLPIIDLRLGRAVAA